MWLRSALRILPTCLAALLGCGEPPSVDREATGAVISPSPTPELLLPFPPGALPSPPAVRARPYNGGGLQLSIQPGSGAGALEETVIWRRAPNSGAPWGLPLASLRPALTEWTDTSVGPGQSYEYLVAVRPQGSGDDRYALLEAGLDVQPARGRVIVLVDASIAAALAPELRRLERDLVADGWSVVRHDVERSRSVEEVKALVRATWAADPQSTKSLLLFGHVPVPYSGRSAFDGHYTVGAYGQHTGAWTADNYYGELTSGFGVDGWTDEFVTDTGAAYADYTPRPENFNIPGDGKLDQDYAPSELELAVGRVDLSNMPAFGQTEVALLRQYLQKDHEYRFAEGRFFTPLRPRVVINNMLWPSTLNAVVEDFPPLSESQPFVGLDYAKIGPRIHQLTEQDDAIWAYNFDTAYFRGQYHISNTLELAKNQRVRIPFFTSYGSFFGDWEISDNYLRAPLCTSGYGLASTYGVHLDARVFGLGGTIGEATRRPQKPVSFGLMGDPTLRLQVVPPPAGFSARATGGTADLRWGAARGAVLGYNIYRAADEPGPYTLINTAGPVPGSRLLVPDARPGEWFMVRAVRRELTSSGSFVNLSEGLTRQVGPTPSALPRILAQPVSVKAPAGRAAAFAVGAASREVQYQWFHRPVGGAERPLAGETRPGLMIPAVDPTKLGSYRCEVRSAFGASSSEVVQLSLAEPRILPLLQVEVEAEGSVNLPDFDPHLPGVVARLTGAAEKGVVRRDPTSPSGLVYQASPGFDGRDVVPYLVDDGVTVTQGTIRVDIHDPQGWSNQSLPGLRGTDSYASLGGTVGSARVSGGQWQLRGFGHGSPGDYGLIGLDNFGYFEHQPISGGFEVTVHSAGFEADLGNAGLAIWDGTSAGRTYAFFGLNRTNLISHYLRSSAEGTVVEWLEPLETAGRYLRLRRQWETITRFVSADGVEWRPIGEPIHVPGLPEALEVGLFVAGSIYQEPGAPQGRPLQPDPEQCNYRAGPPEPAFMYPAVATFEGYSVIQRH